MAKILILNDEPDLLEVSAMVLEDMGHCVETISTGNGILEAARRFDPDLVLIDWVMPGVQGDQVFRNLRSGLEKKMPILLMSALADGAEKARTIGTDGFLPKPFDARQLKELVGKALNGGAPKST